MIILSQNFLSDHAQEVIQKGSASLEFIEIDDGDAYILSHVVPDIACEASKRVGGILQLASELSDAPGKDLGDNKILVVVKALKQVNDEQHFELKNYDFQAWLKTANGVERRTVQVVPAEEELFSRIRGLYETDVLQSKTVLIVGVGSGGSVEAIELAKAGVGKFILIDHDRVELANVVRHVCGLSDLGRYKTKAVRDLILDKNPHASVETHEQKCDSTWLSELREMVRRADLVFCSTDNRDSRVLVNRACIDENRICIYGGTFSRAYGGQVLRVVPGETMCYQCFIDTLPEVDEDREISNQEQADAIAYADRPVAVEPGLATDIAPMALMAVKLGILELLRGTETTLASLYDDLSYPWFMWLNRREIGTQYEQLEPMSKSGDGIRIMTWYGVVNERNSGCPVCGNFVALQVQQSNLHQPTQSEINAFASSVK